MSVKYMKLETVVWSIVLWSGVHVANVIQIGKRRYGL